MRAKRHPQNNIIINLAYPRDLENLYAFYCARYENITFKEFLKLPITDLMMKLSSIPESEPLYKIIQSRTIKIEEIKDKGERKYWNDLKRANKIPTEYMPITRRGDKSFDFKRLENI